jgi:hypothetical protein
MKIMDKKVFQDINLDFRVLNKGITVEQIDGAIPFDFEDKEYFKQFYLVHDGVYFPEGAAINMNEFHEIEFIYNIEHLKKMWEAIKERSSEAKVFAETHFPFARDAAGNEFFIEIPAGLVKYVSWEYGLPDGEVLVAPNFSKFCLAIKCLE